LYGSSVTWSPQVTGLPGVVGFLDGGEGHEAVGRGFSSTLASDVVPRPLEGSINWTASPGEPASAPSQPSWQRRQQI
jgi:hypothetical protein